MNGKQKIRIDHLEHELPHGVKERQLKSGSWRYDAFAYINGKSKRIGAFETPELANKARNEYIGITIGDKPHKSWSEDLTGQQFGHGIVISRTDERDKDGSVKWLLQCDCGNQYTAGVTNLKSGKIVSCGHIGRSIKPGMQDEIKEMRKHKTSISRLTRKKPRSNKSGYKGVSVVKSHGNIRYRANLTVAGVLHAGSLYDNPEDAYKERLTFEQKYTQPKIAEIKQDYDT